MKIVYRDLPKWKYQLLEDWHTRTDMTGFDITKDLFSLGEYGLLIVCRGYCWDGPSGPTIDTKSFMRGSLAHDVFYQMMREKLLPMSVRKTADKVLVKLCREDGMSWVRRKYVYRSLRMFARGAAKTKGVMKILRAP